MSRRYDKLLRLFRVERSKGEESSITIITSISEIPISPGKLPCLIKAKIEGHNEQWSINELIIRS